MLHPRQRQVVAAQGRAFVAGDERRCAQPSAPVPPHLVHGQAHQRLYSGQIDSALLLLILGIQLHFCPVESATALYYKVAISRPKDSGCNTTSHLTSALRVDAPCSARWMPAASQSKNCTASPIRLF